MSSRFADRAEAGRRLGEDLAPRYAERDDLLVLGLPRGGVPVAVAVAAALDAPLDVLVVRKVGVPGHSELAMGAVGGGGVLVRNDEVIWHAGVGAEALERVVAQERVEVDRRERYYRGDRPPLDAVGRVAILVDDGLATGASMSAAVATARHIGAASVVVAVPVGAPEACDGLRKVADDVVCLLVPAIFQAVGEWYADFRQMTDDEVRRLLGS